jgi:hypothetical protein
MFLQALSGKPVALDHNPAEGAGAILKLPIFVEFRLADLFSSQMLRCMSIFMFQILSEYRVFHDLSPVYLWVIVKKRVITCSFVSIFALKP